MKLKECLFILLVGLAGVQALPAQEADLGREVQEIFALRCGECHGPDLKKPKGKFGFVTDLDRVREVYIGTAEAGDSDLWLSITDPYEPMPPKKSKHGPLLAAELETIETWIAGGALAPRPLAKASETTELPEPIEAPIPVNTEVDDGNEFLAGLHPLVVHFPIALVLVAAFAELLIWRFGTDHANSVRLMLSIGLAGACAASLTGWSAADFEGYRDSVVFNHRWLGVAATGISALAFLTIERGRKLESNRWLLSGRLLLLAAAILVGLAGHQGGELVHG